MMSLLQTMCMAQVVDSVTYPVVTVASQRIAEAIGSSVTETDTLLYSMQRGRGLAQVLETESFISTRAYSPGGVANFSVRGTGSQHTQVVWEGIPINDPMLGQTDLSAISLGGIGQVRVLYGSAGMTNNSGGIGGTIELIPQEKRTTDGFDGKLNVYAGSFGTYGVSVQLRDSYKKVFGTTSVEYQTAKNDFTYRNLASIKKEDKKLEHAAIGRIGFTRTMGVRFNERNSIKASVYYAQVDREFAPTMLMASTNETLFDRDIWAALNWNRIGKRSKVSVTSSYIFGQQDFFDNNNYIFHHLYHANKNLLRYELRLKHDLHLELGGDVFNETARSDSAYRHQAHWRFWQAAFASLKYVPKKWVAAQVLIREDVIDGAFSPIQGLVGVEVKPLRWFYLKGNVARNFRAPTLNDLYWVPGGNADLKSETGFSGEAGLGFRSETERFKFNAEATYFRSTISNWVIWLPIGNVWTPQNKRAVGISGVEARLETTARLGKVLIRLNGAYTWVSSKIIEGATETDVSVGKQLIYVPQHQAKANVSVHLGKLYFIYVHQFTGLRFTTSDNKDQLPAYQVGQLSVGYAYAIGKHTIGLGFTLDNLFNTEYQTIAWRPMPGRSFLINLNYQFL